MISRISTLHRSGIKLKKSMNTYPDNINPAAYSIISDHFLLRNDLGTDKLPQSLTFLEFGCSTGALGASLMSSNRNIAWYGIDYNEYSLSIASKRLTKTFYIDLNNITGLRLNMLDIDPDLLILVDVLEHVYEPNNFMSVIRESYPRSSILCVLPNISCYQTYERLSMHEFDYEDHGIFDKTHKTFYTAASAIKQFALFGYKLSTGPLFLPDPVTHSLLQAEISYPYVFVSDRFSVKVDSRDHLLSLCSYGFGCLFDPTL